MATLIYGASDDLIEVEGDLREEFSAYDFDGYIAVSNGVLLKAHYGEEWTFSLVRGHADVVAIEAPRGGDDTDDEGVPGYSARVRIAGPVEWVALVRADEDLVR